MTANYFVEQRYDDRGKIRTRILTADEAATLGYIDGFSEDREKYDLYVDGFATLKEAQKFCAECARA